MSSPINPVNIKYFEASCWSDTTLTMAQKCCLANLFPLLESQYQNPDAINEYWVFVVQNPESQNPPNWLTPTAQSVIQNYAQEYGIPLST